MIVIAKNNTENDIIMNDLGGLKIPASGQVELFGENGIFKFYVVASSLNLKAKVATGDIIINDGNEDLSISDGLKHIEIKSVYDMLSQTQQDLVRDIHINFCAFDYDNSWAAKLIYFNVAKILYLGMNNVGSPDSIDFIACMDDPTAKGSVRIYDYTNNQVICEAFEQVTSDSPQLYSMTQFSNLSDEKAIWEIQIKTDTNAKCIRLYELTVIF